MKERKKERKKEKKKESEENRGNQAFSTDNGAGVRQGFRAL